MLAFFEAFVSKYLYLCKVIVLSKNYVLILTKEMVQALSNVTCSPFSYFDVYGNEKIGVNFEQREFLCL